ncbi:uracil-DNA glycosylase family protein [uncultured Tateyamaria sp.]|uniref:uracil-DNA glycosylase family protein n=1 Tax=uncultured Tateyamaria sp. TaxID=455651 RepID=UPI0026056A36|nr:uracil-DNA glycosylase family protein [uncultured Tateyamaria sp.]
MTRDFDSLTTKMRACTVCEGLPLGPNPIFQLSAGARILIVGQAPGRITHYKNRPFDDPSGERLRAWMGIDRDAFYTDPRIGIFPMGLCFPGSAPGGDAPPRPECAATWRAPVMEMLEDVELTLILGAYAIAWHAPYLKGYSVRDAVRTSGAGEDGVFVLPHPSPRNNRWLKQNDWFEAEIVPRIQRRVARLLQ